jgi:subtilisin-like proprotein convertase family protein
MGETSIKAARVCLLAGAALLGSGLASAVGLGIVPAPPPECGSTDPVVFSDATALPLVDGGVVSTTIEVSGLGPYLWDVGVQTHLVHSFSSDLSVTLTSPAGTVVTLTSRNGGGNADVFDGTIWDDQSNPGGQVPYFGNNGLVTDEVYSNGVTASPLAPEEALGAFVGEDPNGTWTLKIGDAVAGHTGVLNGWSLAMAALPKAPSVISRFSPSNSTSVAIPDNGSVTSTIDVPDGIGSRLCKVSVITSITHPNCGDLEITLRSPGGTVVTLSTDNGGSNDNVFNGTLWDDDANPGGQIPYVTNDGLVTDQAYVNGVPVATLVPEEGLAAFNGQSPVGTWTLTVGDDSPGGSGVLAGWTLNIVTCSCAESFPGSPLRVDEHGDGFLSNLNGVFEAGETVTVEPSWTNPGTTPFTLVTYAHDFTGPAGPIYTFLDAGAAYGTVPALSTNNCYDASGDCYRLQITGARPAQHWDATFDEIAAPIALGQSQQDPYFATWMLHVGGSFADVPQTDPFYRSIETIFHLGITGGGSCGGYCSGASALRKQMAVFLLKSKDGAGYVPPPATGIFTDVPVSDPFAPWIEELYNRGIAAGCGSGPAYCPNLFVKRQQMAVFLLKTLLGSDYTPPPATGIFFDVPVSDTFAPWIEDLYNRGIAGGCGGGRFCPRNPNTRGQMAAFLTKTFGLQLYGP